MISKTNFHIKLYFATGTAKEAIIEDDGLSLDKLRQSIQDAIDEDDYYVMHNILNDEWTVIRADRIEAFSITDVGADASKVAGWGAFDFK